MMAGDGAVTAVRTATDVDWSGISAIVREVAAAGDTFTFPRKMDDELACTLWRPGSPGIVLVATDAKGAVCGSAKVGPNRMGPGSHVATASFVVAEGARGRGVGRSLGQAAVRWARSTGFQAMQFNAVVSTNEPAVQLWRTLGFTVVGRVPAAFILPTGAYADLLVMHRAL